MIHITSYGSAIRESIKDPLLPIAQPGDSYIVLNFMANKERDGYRGNYVRKWMGISNPEIYGYAQYDSALMYP